VKSFCFFLDPEFISSTQVASEGKILLFFTEVGDLTGDSLVNSFIVSRVGQVCTVRLHFFPPILKHNSIIIS